MFELAKLNRNRALDPFKDFNDLVDDFFGKGIFKNSALSSAQAFAFMTDIKDNGDAYQLEADLPGFKKEDIKIDLEGNFIKINADRHSEIEEKDKQGNYIRCERSYGSYSRSFDVSNVKTDEIKTTYKDGVLTLIMPKKEAKAIPASKRLEIE